MTGIIPVAALGAIVGFSLWVAWRFTFPPPPPLDLALRRLSRQHAISDTGTGPALKRRVGARTGGLLEGLGLSLDDIRADARIVGTSLEAHLGSKVASAAPTIPTASAQRCARGSADTVDQAAGEAGGRAGVAGRTFVVLSQRLRSPPL